MPPLSPLLRSVLIQRKWWAPGTWTPSSSNLNTGGVDLYSHRRLILHKMKLEPTSKSVAASLRDATGKESLTHKPYSEVGEPIHFRSDTWRSASTHSQIHVHTQECVPPTSTGHSLDVDSGVTQITPRPTRLQTSKPRILQPRKLSRARGIERKRERMK